MLDNIDLRILKILGADGRISNSEISRRLQVAEGTIRQRLKKLMECGVLHTHGNIDTQHFPELNILIIGLTLNVLPDDCLDEVIKIPNILFTLTVTGRYDIIVVAIANSREMLSHIIEAHLQKVPGVGRTETFIVLRNYGMFINAEKFVDMLQYMEKHKNNDKFEDGRK